MPRTAYEMAPKERLANLTFRRKLNRMGHENPEAARNLWIACRRDILFWINAFCWIFEPRKQQILPWITWDFQDDTIRKMDAVYGEMDIGIEKSRDMGASWIMVVFLAHREVFYENCMFLMISRNEALVDKPDDPKSLFSKHDFLLKHLPQWMRPPMKEGVDRKFLHYRNPLTNSGTDGESTTGDAGRGDRRLAIPIDELAAFKVPDSHRVMASSQSATDCRVFNSTPQGAVGAFYNIMHQQNAKMLKIRLHWSQHPHKRKGLYTSRKGEVEILDRDYDFPPDYLFVTDGPFHVEGGLRSPWYDNECNRPGITPQMIAQELDINYHGSNYPYFAPHLVDRVLERDPRPPLWVGELEYDDETAMPHEFQEVERGQLRLWCNFLDRGRPDRSHEYCAGADVATGAGASNSVLYIADRMTREVVAEYASAWVSEGEFARLAVALCRWFGDAFLAWEDNGPGGTFGRKVRKLRYRNFYWRKTRPEGTKQKATDVPGWYSTPVTKKMILGDLREAMDTGSFVQRSLEGIEECRCYKWTPTQQVVHEKAEDNEDPTGARDNHGDRVIAAAVTLLALGERGPVDRDGQQAEKDPPAGSLLWRRQRRAARTEEESPLVFS